MYMYNCISAILYLLSTGFLRPSQSGARRFSLLPAGSSVRLSLVQDASLLPAGSAQSVGLILAWNRQWNYTEFIAE